MHFQIVIETNLTFVFVSIWLDRIKIALEAFFSLQFVVLQSFLSLYIIYVYTYIILSLESDPQKTLIHRTVIHVVYFNILIFYLYFN